MSVWRVFTQNEEEGPNGKEPTRTYVHVLCACSNHRGRFLSAVLTWLGINLNQRFACSWATPPYGARAPFWWRREPHLFNTQTYKHIHLCLIVEFVLVEGVLHPKLIAPFRILAALGQR